MLYNVMFVYFVAGHGGRHISRWLKVFRENPVIHTDTGFPLHIGPMYRFGGRERGLPLHFAPH